MISSTKDGSSTASSFERLRSSSDSINSTGADSPGRDNDRLYDEELGGEEELLQDTPVATPDVRRRKSMRPGGVRTDWLVRCANEWCARSGGEALRASSRERSYEELVASSAISEEDAEQIDMDVERSGVDDLHLITADCYQEAAHLASLRRVLRALCVRTPGVYCQGVNFVAAVLLVVMEHGSDDGGNGEGNGDGGGGGGDGGGGDGGDGDGGGSRGAASPVLSWVRRVSWATQAGVGVAAQVVPQLELGGGDGADAEAGAASSTAAAVGVGVARGEAAAFWTLLGVLALLPSDFYEAPSMAGLQCEVRVFRQLIRAELPRCEAATWSGDELASVLQLISYKWFVPLFVNQARPVSLMTHARMHARTVRAAPTCIETHARARTNVPRFVLPVAAADAAALLRRVAHPACRSVAAAASPRTRCRRCCRCRRREQAWPLGAGSHGDGNYLRGSYPTCGRRAIRQRGRRPQLGGPSAAGARAA